MAIIYTYPVKTTPNDNDLILISDSQDSNRTKQVKISSLPGGSGSGVSSVTSANTAITVADASTTPVLTSVAYSGGANIGHVPTGSGSSATVYLDGTGNWSTPSGSGGGTPATPTNSVQFNNAGAFGGSADLTFTANTLAVKHTVDVKGQGQNLSAGKLKLNCEMNTHAVTIEGPIHNNSGSNYTLKLPSLVPQNNQILQFTSAGNLGWINTPTGGGGSVSITADNTSTDYVDIQVTPSPITGTGTIMADLNAVNGTSDTTTRFLSKDNTWDVPSYTTDTTYNVMGSGNSYAAGLVLAGNTTHGNEFLRKDGTWQTVSAAPSSPVNSVQFNNSGAFGGSANLTYSSDTLTIKDNIVVRGDGTTNAGKLRLECYDNVNTHYVDLIGPDHGGGASSYSIKFPAAGPTANNKILESNSSGALSWIDTPTGGGTTPTSGTWYATLARYDGASYAASATQAQIVITTNDCQWYRIGDMMYYQFYIAGTIKSSGSLTGNLFLCRSLNAAGTTTTYGLPTVSANSPTIVNNGFCNGSVTITESEAPAQALAWTYPVNGGRVGRDTSYAGYVQLFSLYNSGTTNKVYYPLSNQVWLTNNGEDPANWALGGTINALVEHVS